MEQVGTRDREDYYFEEGPSLSGGTPTTSSTPWCTSRRGAVPPGAPDPRAGAILPLEQMPIAEFLVGNLDERGFLECSVEEVARILESAWPRCGPC